MHLYRGNFKARKKLKKKKLNLQNVYFPMVQNLLKKIKQVKNVTNAHYIMLGSSFEASPDCWAKYCVTGDGTTKQSQSNCTLWLRYLAFCLLCRHIANQSSDKRSKGQKQSRSQVKQSQETYYEMNKWCEIAHIWSKIIHADTRD